MTHEDPVHVDTKPLGYLSMGLGAVALLLAISYLLCGWTYPFALAGGVLGIIGRSAQDARTLSTVGLALSGLAAIIATTILAVALL